VKEDVFDELYVVGEQFLGLSTSKWIMAKQRVLPVIILAFVLALTFNWGPDFVGPRNPVSESTTSRMAVIGKDSQGKFRFLVDGVVPEPPPPPRGSSFGETMIGVSVVMWVCFQVAKLM